MGRKAVSGHNGYRGRVFYASNELCVTSWSLDLTVDEEETTNSCSAGGKDYEYGAVGGTGTIEADWDVTANPFDDPPNITLGEKVTLLLYVHSAPGVGAQDGPFWSFTAAVTSISMSVPATGKVTYTMNFTVNGTITYPTGDLSSGA